MPFCPDCRTEYRPGFTRCSDCGATLVAERPETAEPDEVFRMTKLVEFLTPAEAGMIKEVLEQNGIPVFMRGGQADPIGIVSGAEYAALFVDERDLERALELYQAFFGDIGDDEEGEDEIED